MNQIAVFVDAGYLMAEGAILLTGRFQPRSRLRLDVEAVLDELRDRARAIAEPGRLLRIYWYDGLARRETMNLEQQRIAQSRDVKARFGRVNVRGEQKGVDALIITDLIDLARAHAISDALIVAGDEDIRIGLEKAQSYGVRVHLLGIAPVQDNQSVNLLNEADATDEWSRDQVERWLSVATTEMPSAQAASIDETEPIGGLIATVVAERVALLDSEDVDWILDHVARSNGRLPSEFDGPSLATLGVRVGRQLSDDERREFRGLLLRAVQQKLEPDEDSANGS